MHLRVSIALGLFAAALTVWAEEKLPVLKVGSDVYSNVTVTAVTATDIYFTHANGVANAKLKKLEPELQKHFGYNPAAAGKVELKQAQANAQYRNQLASGSSSQPLAGENVEQADGLTWSLDLPQALARARSGDKMVLLDFTGSDWCPWCIKFDNEVLSTDKFAKYAEAKLVLVLVDFPRHKLQSPTLKQANQEVARKYHVDGFPTYVVLNSAGNEIGRQTGYAPGGPDAFIARLERFGK
jgi:thioredoxin-related protein